jgi:hypothetical protein
MSTPMTPAEKAWIEAASYTELLRHWRFAGAGDPMFTGETGKHYSKMLSERRDADHEGHVKASKGIGWDR